MISRFSGLNGLMSASKGDLMAVKDIDKDKDSPDFGCHENWQAANTSALGIISIIKRRVDLFGYLKVVTSHLFQREFSFYISRGKIILNI